MSTKKTPKCRKMTGDEMDNLFDQNRIGILLNQGNDPSVNWVFCIFNSQALATDAGNLELSGF